MCLRRTKIIVTDLIRKEKHNYLESLTFPLTFCQDWLEFIWKKNAADCIKCTVPALYLVIPLFDQLGVGNCRKALKLQVSEGVIWFASKLIDSKGYNRNNEMKCLRIVNSCDVCCSSMCLWKLWEAKRKGGTPKSDLPGCQPSAGHLLGSQKQGTARSESTNHMSDTQSASQVVVKLSSHQAKGIFFEWQPRQGGLRDATLALGLDGNFPGLIWFLISRKKKRSLGLEEERIPWYQMC